MKIIQRRKIFFVISGTICLISIISIILWGFNFGIDFKGGTLIELSFKDSRPETQKITQSLESLELGTLNIQPVEEKDLIVRLKSITEEDHQKIIANLKKNFEFQEKRFESIGPVIGQELKTKTFYSIVLALIGMVLYIAWAFWKVSKPVTSWKYGVIAIIALFHDILIAVGLFVVLGHFLKVEINAYFVAALLTILGYSVNDTIVIFDRTRENLLHRTSQEFEETVNRSVNENIIRSLNTSLTTLFVLLAVYFLGGETIKYFVLALIFGVMIGTYSSIFIASPLLVVWQRLSMRR
ncbi:MAG: protein translocase subunit SecF [Parcubacteria group bacterium CG23_combo_of_CG06-09_8_20_14_all_35_9]|nr:MAG: protein translocase subunit SecF [Parcubacteria group bacterium CG23_combo_of_CG06-09_8_20_14_all_35_9]